MLPTQFIESGASEPPNSDAFPSSHKAPFLRSTRVILTTYLLLISIIAIGTGTLIQQDRLDQQRAHQTELSSMARSMQEYAMHTLHSVRTEKEAVLSPMQIQALRSFFDNIQLTPQDQFTVFTLDGLRLLPHKTAPEATPDFPRTLAHLKNTGSLESTYTAEGERYQGAFRRIPNEPLIVLVSRPLTMTRAGYSSTEKRLLLSAGSFALLLSLLAWFIYTDAKRHRQARLMLEQLKTKLEARVGRRTAELEQSNRELVAFSYSISHDLRAPLRAINGFAHALKEDFGSQLTEQGCDHLDRIYRASVRMGELIDELLSLANLSQAPLNIRDVNLSVIAQEIIDELRLHSPGRHVEFETQQNLHTEGDEALLRNALSNLLHNAWKFTREKQPGTIRLAAQKVEGGMDFILADNGVGFDMAHAKRLFQPFQQLHGQQYGGSGIGLASVRRIIERHGGQIRVESEPEQGTRFIFTLPLRAKVIRRRRD